MRVQLDNGVKSVDLECEYSTQSLLYLIAKALQAMDYSKNDLIREWTESDSK